MFDEPIKTIEKAKEYFREFHCSGFHMAHDGSEERNEEYKQLNITEQMESEWIEEQFDEFYFGIMENKLDPSTFWEFHWRMYDLYAKLKTNSMFLKILAVTRYIRDTVPVLDKVIIAETINGRTIQSARTGLVYNAYDSGNIEAAKEFAELSLHFSSYGKEKRNSKQRCLNANKLCKDIKRELGLR